MKLEVTASPPALGAPNGVGREAFSRWYRYPAGFSRDTLAAALTAASAKRGDTVVDCFAGVATTGIACARAGLGFVGIEGHPLIAELAALKVKRPSVTGATVRNAGRALADELRDTTVKPADAEADLMQRCYSEETLAELAWLRDRLVHDRRWAAPYLRWALIGALRETASVKTGWPYQMPNVARRDRVPTVETRFRARANAIGEDVDLWTNEWVPGTIVRGDSRASKTWRHVPDGSIAACITSPPYLNNYDYLDATRLEMYFLGRAMTWSDLLGVARQNLVVATTHHATKSAVTAATKTLSTFDMSDQIESLAGALANERHKRPRGKEYDYMLRCYLADMSRVLTNLGRVMRQGGRVVLVVGDSAPYGVYVDTPGLLARLAGELSFDTISDTSVRDRGLRWRTNGTRHRVGLSERLVVLKRR